VCICVCVVCVYVVCVRVVCAHARTMCYFHVGVSITSNDLGIICEVRSQRRLDTFVLAVHFHCKIFISGQF